MNYLRPGTFLSWIMNAVLLHHEAPYKTLHVNKYSQCRRLSSSFSLSMDAGEKLFSLISCGVHYDEEKKEKKMPNCQ